MTTPNIPFNPILILKIIQFIIELIIGGMSKEKAIQKASSHFDVPESTISKFKGL